MPADDAISPEPCAVVIFGATGDLTARKLMPALYALHRSGKLHERTAIVGFGRSELRDEALRDRLARALADHQDEPLGDAWARLAERISYVRGDYDEPAAYARLADHLREVGLPDHLYYTGTPQTIAGLGGDPADNRKRSRNPDTFLTSLLDSHATQTALLLKRFLPLTRRRNQRRVRRIEMRQQRDAGTPALE